MTSCPLRPADSLKPIQVSLGIVTNALASPKSCISISLLSLAYLFSYANFLQKISRSRRSETINSSSYLKVVISRALISSVIERLLFCAETSSAAFNSGDNRNCIRGSSARLNFLKLTFFLVLNIIILSNKKRPGIKLRVLLTWPRQLYSISVDLRY